MKVIFDYQIFYLQRYGGISRYFYELANALAKKNNCNPEIVAPFTSNEYLENASNKNFVMTFNPLLKKLGYNRFYDARLKINEYYGKRVSSGKNTILHETYYTHRFPVKCPKVITVHDMIYELFSKNSEDEKKIIQKKKQAILEADSIITVSENTRKDLIHFYPEVKDKTVVVYHGVDQSDHPEVQRLNRAKSFMLHVGNRGWYKNFERFLEVYGTDNNVNNTFDIICFGGGKMTHEESVLLKKYNIESKVFFISGSDEVLTSLYKAAAALIYISNYEGFGMPLLEAMVLSCPVLSSNTSSLPEVYGNAALAIDPANSNDLGNGIKEILFNSELRKNLIEAGKKRAAEFTWEKCADKTLGVYKKLI